MLWGDTISSKHLKVVMLVLSMTPFPVYSDALSEPCVRPEAPISVTVGAADAYRDLISADYDAYFVAASDYIGCLDAERAHTLSDMAKAAEDYDAFLATPSPGAFP